MSVYKERQHTSDDSGFIPYPINRVVGIIDDLKDVHAALRDLKAAGFAADEIRVLSGKQGANRLDV